MTYGSPFEMDEHLWMIEEALYEENYPVEEGEIDSCPTCGQDACKAFGMDDLGHLMQEEMEAEYAAQAEENLPTYCFDDWGFCPGCEDGVPHNHIETNPGPPEEVPF